MPSAQERTEKPTARRRREARRRGQVARSADLNGALVLIAGLVAISTFGPTVVGELADSMRLAFARISTPQQATSAAGLGALFHAALSTLVRAGAPLAGVCLAAGLVANVTQVGLRPSLSALRPDFRRLNLAAGIRQLFGARTGFEGAKVLVKVTAVGAVVALALIPQLTDLGAQVGAPPAALGALLASGARGMAERAAGAYLLIGAVDVLWQRRRLARNLRMTRQEVREEQKQHVLPPEVRSALRRRQLQAARARMMAAVPSADVVVTNPTHFAVALSYDGSQVAPVVVAKGQDLVALRIRSVAVEHGVPIVPDPPLARSLHGSVEIGQLIPAELYAAVAQVLAYVYRMSGRRRAAA